MARDHCKLRYHSLHGLIFLGLFAFLRWNMNRTVIVVSMAWGNMSSMDRKVAFRQSPGRMLYAAKTEDRHLSERTEPHPVKRTVKKYKVFPASSQALLAAFLCSEIK